MTREIIVAIKQFMPKTADISANLTEIKAALEKAAEIKAHVLVLPELSLTGYMLEDKVYDVALTMDSPHLTELADATAKTGVDLVVGFPYRETDGIIYNTTAYVDHEGSITLAPKIMLPNHSVFNEKRYFKPGKSVTLVETSWGTVGLQTCYDLYVPAISELLVARGAEILISPSASPGMRQAYFEAIVASRSIENAVPVVYVNQGGIMDTLVFWGGSEVRTAYGERVLKLKYDQADWGHVKLELGSAKRAKTFLPSQSESPSWLYHELAEIKDEV